jgi:hypothetical protein
VWILNIGTFKNSEPGEKKERVLSLCGLFLFLPILLACSQLRSETNEKWKSEHQLYF